MRKTWLVMVIAFFVLSVAMSARADTMWTLTAGGAVCGPTPCTGVTFNDGATATGSFVIPSSASSATLDVGDLLSTTFDIKTTDGQNTPHIIGFEYDNANSTATYTPGFGPFGGPYADEVLFASNDGKHFLQLLLPTGTTYDLATTTGTHVLSEGLTGSVSNELGICSNVADDSTITLCANSASSDFRDVVSGALNDTTLGGGSPPPPTVPEPGTLPLLATGLAALAAVGLKKGLLTKVA